MSMIMPLAENVRMVTRFRAQIMGMVNWVPNKPKLVLTGEALILMRPCPTVSCHHGMKSEMTSATKVMIPARRGQAN